MRAAAGVVLASLAACTHPTVRAPAPLPAGRASSTSAPASADAEFQDLAVEVAARRALVVAAWGTANLDEDAELERVAVLLPRASDSDSDMAYLLEDHPGRRWLVTATYDGRTEAWLDPGAARSPADPVQRPPWQTIGDTVLSHTQTHHHGDESWHLGFRNGTLVRLHHDVLNDSTDPTPDDGASDDVAPLASDPEGYGLRLVVGPARTAAALAPAAAPVAAPKP